MKRKLLQWLAAGLMGVTFLAGSGDTAKAQDGWRNRVYYGAPYRSYYAGPRYSSLYYGAPTYYRSYSVQPYYTTYGPPAYYGSYYGPTYSGRYYGLPNAGYYETPYGGGQVNVGGLRIGW
jgi:hypothetical protein